MNEEKPRPGTGITGSSFIIHNSSFALMSSFIIPRSSFDGSVAAALMLVTSLAPGMPAAAQSYPDRPIRLVVGFPPGGAADILGRFAAQHFQCRVRGEKLGAKRFEVLLRLLAARGQPLQDGWIVPFPLPLLFAANLSAERGEFRLELLLLFAL